MMRHRSKIMMEEKPVKRAPRFEMQSNQATYLLTYALNELMLSVMRCPCIASARKVKGGGRDRRANEEKSEREVKSMV